MTIFVLFLNITIIQALIIINRNNMKEVNYSTLASAGPMVVESLPIKTRNLEARSKVFEVARTGDFPTINLKTGRTGKGEGCPYACVYCDVGNKNGGYWQETSEDNFKTLINNWANQGGKIIHWCGDGEPTTFKWFDTILDLAKEKGFTLEVFSNLSGLTPERAKKLMEIRATVKFKLDSRKPLTLGEIMTNAHGPEAISVGIRHLNNIDMLVKAKNQSDTKPQLIASIVVSKKNKVNLIGVLEWCCKFGVVPNIGFLEEIGSAIQTGTKALTEKETKRVNFWLKTKFGLKDPKQIMGDQCEGKTAPILIGKKIYLGPFGMGCEFPLREHIGELNFIGEYQEDIGELKNAIRDFRFSQENLTAIINELQKIRDQEGVYSKSGTDEILPGCGDDIEELWFLEYVTTLFTSDEYFKNFINNWVLKGEHRKWTETEVNDLINQVKTHTNL
jgi:MoaA/NifB/PqqE/SkfB family radical SAM enzyme